MVNWDTAITSLTSDRTSDPLADPQVAAPTARRHDLDALRGFAMLLGIALHATIAFVPYQPENSSGQALTQTFFDFVHGFRMPIFFLLSGYFTTMLWRSRGSVGLSLHRIKRIVLPLAVGVVTIVPLVRAALDAAPAIAGTSAKASSQVFGFSHLWFLWFLTLMVVGFVAVTSAHKVLSIASPTLATRVSRLSGRSLFALPLLTVVPASRMVDTVFGADYSDALIPNDGVLAYYACFFTFGALLFARTSRGGLPLIDAVGRFWKLQLLVSSFVLFPLGLWLMADHQGASSIAQVAFAWMTSFGLLGAFRTLMSKERAIVSWLSDASYWMYLAHLPAVIVLQALASRLGLPPVLAFPSIFVVTTFVMMMSYEQLIRYSPIGTVLNGSRTRNGESARGPRTPSIV